MCWALMATSLAVVKQKSVLQCIRAAFSSFGRLVLSLFTQAVYARVAETLGVTSLPLRSTAFVLLAARPAESVVLPHCRDLNLEFEIPFRELGFNGVPFRSTAFVMPTVNCLVELVEMPFTVVAIPEVAIVNLERVGFNLRNFDMVIIFKVPPIMFTGSKLAYFHPVPIGHA